MVVVTGASSGLGNSCATVLAKRGFRVYGTSRAPEERARRADEFFELVAMDVRDDYSVRTALSYVMEREGRIDAVVHGAGYGISGPVEEIASDAAAAQIDACLIGACRVAHEALPALRASKGALLFIGSMAGRLALPYQAHYTAAKFGLEGFVDALRLETLGLGIRVALIEPGDFRTGFTSARKKYGSGDHSPYAANMARAVDIAERSEREGADPILVSRLVLRLLSAKRVRSRYSVGSWWNRVAWNAARALPSWLVELGLKAYFDLRTKN